MPAGTTLIVDDEPHIRFVLEHKLRNAGWEVVTARDSLQAVEQFRKSLPSMAIVDLRMPGMEGDALCVKLQGMSDHEMPIVLLTGSVIDEAEFRRQIGELPRVRYMSQPFSPQELLETVREMLGDDETTE